MKTKFTLVTAWLIAMAFTFQCSANVLHHCPPANLSVVASEEGPLQLTWCHYGGATCEPISGFHVKVRVCVQNQHTVIDYYVADCNDPVAMLLEVVPGTTCQWKVRSVSWAGSPQERHSIWARGPDICGASERLDPWDDEEVFNEALIYPNPVFNSTMCVRINSWSRGSAALTVATLNGQIVYTEVLPIEPGANYGDIDLSRLQAGVYFVRVSDAYKSRTAKIVKL